MPDCYPLSTRSRQVRSVVMVRLWAVLLSILFLALLQGCLVTPSPLTQKDIQGRMDHNLVYMTKNQEPIDGPIDIFEAIARTLRYNLETKVELMNTMLAHQQLDLAHYNLLPDLVANAAYDGRSNYSGARSRSLITGTESLEPSTSAQKNIFTADLSLSWDVLDFGLSYVRAQQAADNVLIAEEEKRRVANRVVQETRLAFWKTASANRILGRLTVLDKLVEEALQDVKIVRERQLNTPLSPLRYQREILATKREIHQLVDELSLSRLDLAKLMNVPPDQTYNLFVGERRGLIPDLKASVKELEQRALLNRPELRTIDYQKRINEKETKAAILDMLPNLNLHVGPHYNSNNFLYNNHWLGWGARVSWNLLNLFRKPSHLKAIDLQEDILQQQSLAVSMAIVSQVHIGLAQLGTSKEHMQISREYFQTQKQIGEQTEHSWTSRRSSKKALIREQLNTLLAELQYERAVAEHEAAYSTLLTSVGEDILPASLVNKNIKEMSKAIKKRWKMITTSHIKKLPRSRKTKRKQL